VRRPRSQFRAGAPRLRREGHHGGANAPSVIPPRVAPVGEDARAKARKVIGHQRWQLTPLQSERTSLGATVAPQAAPDRLGRASVHAAAPAGLSPGLLSFARMSAHVPVQQSMRTAPADSQPLMPPVSSAGMPREAPSRAEPSGRPTALRAPGRAHLRNRPKCKEAHWRDRRSRSARPSSHRAAYARRRAWYAASARSHEARRAGCSVTRRSASRVATLARRASQCHRPWHTS